MSDRRVLLEKDVAEIIYQAIEEEKYLKRTTIIPVITAVLKAFKINNGISFIEKNSEARKRAADIANAERIYWQRKCKELDPENIEKYYNEVSEIRSQFEIPTN